MTNDSDYFARNQHDSESKIQIPVVPAIYVLVAGSNISWLGAPDMFMSHTSQRILRLGNVM